MTPIEMTPIEIALICCIGVLLLWNMIVYFFRSRNTENEKLQELNSRINYIVACGSFLILLIGFLGYNQLNNIGKDTKTAIQLRADSAIQKAISEQAILKASLYIVGDIPLQYNKTYYFSKLPKTIDGKNIPSVFKYKPKILLTASSAFSLPIEEVTTEYFRIGKPMTVLITDDSPSYNAKTFDIWIADYKRD
jgi:hypothetical protein